MILTGVELALDARSRDLQRQAGRNRLVAQMVRARSKRRPLPGARLLKHLFRPQHVSAKGRASTTPAAPHASAARRR